MLKMILFLLCYSITVYAAADVAENCSPANDVVVREAFAEWYNEHRYDPEYIPEENGVSIADNLVDVKNIHSQFSPKGQYGKLVYSIVYEMGTETQYATINVFYALDSKGLSVCGSHKYSVAEF